MSNKKYEKNFLDKWFERKLNEMDRYFGEVFKYSIELIKDYFKGLKNTWRVILTIIILTCLFCYLGYKIHILFIGVLIISISAFYSIFFVKSIIEKHKSNKLSRTYNWLYELFNRQVMVIEENENSITINSYIPYADVLKKKELLENRFDRSISSIKKKGKSFRTFIISFDNGKKIKFKKKYYLKDYIKQPEKELSKYRIPFLLGINEKEKNIIADLGKLNHILIAGETDFGKSTFVNCLIQSLQYYNDDILYFLVDFKIVELKVYSKFNNVIFVSEEDFSKYLRKLNNELNRRKNVIADAELQNIKQYNRNYPGKKLPYIVLLIDEVADIRLESEDNKDMESNEAIITRLLNQGRALGIHVIIATQNPSSVQMSTQIRKGLTTKISFKVIGHIGQNQVGIKNTENLDRGEFKMLGDDGKIKFLKGFFCDREESWETFNEILEKRREKDVITF